MPALRVHEWPVFALLFDQSGFEAKEGLRRLAVGTMYSVTDDAGSRDDEEYMEYVAPGRAIFGWNAPPGSSEGIGGVFLVASRAVGRSKARGCFGCEPLGSYNENTTMSAPVSNSYAALTVSTYERTLSKQLRIRCDTPISLWPLLGA